MKRTDPIKIRSLRFQGIAGPGILAKVAAELNRRTRKRLDWATPAEKLNQLLSENGNNTTHPVAPTA